jgi:hypothetical protein
MWVWLNSNAGAFQAVSATVTALVTVILVFITARYVGLTKTLAETASAQMQALGTAAESRRRELRARAEFLLFALRSLPDPSRRQTTETRVKWEDTFDFDRFVTLAAEVSSSASSNAATVVSEMTWLADRASSIPGSPMEDYWKFFSSAEWNNRVIGVRRALEQICEKAGP